MISQFTVLFCTKPTFLARDPNLSRNATTDNTVTSGVITWSQAAAAAVTVHPPSVTWAVCWVYVDIDFMQDI